MPLYGGKVGFVVMEHKKTKKHDGGGLYIAICCCILVIALIGYANNLAQKNAEEEKLLTEQAGENIIAPEAKTPQPVNSLEPEVTVKPEPTAAPTKTPVTPAPEEAEVSKAQEVEEKPLFGVPVGGMVAAEFSKDTPVFHQSIGEYKTHNGVDFASEIGESVAASADGVVETVYMDTLGCSVRIDHGDGLFTVYSNLDDKPTVAPGDSVKKGDVIGHVGNTALGDLCQDPHLHFEVILDGKYQDPAEYLK